MAREQLWIVLTIQLALTYLNNGTEGFRLNPGKRYSTGDVGKLLALFIYFIYLIVVAFV